VVSAAPGHVANVRRHVIDVLDAEQLTQLDDIMSALLQQLDPHARFANAGDVPA
jgi:hypothetical protein